MREIGQRMGDLYRQLYQESGGRKGVDAPKAPGKKKEEKLRKEEKAEKREAERRVAHELASLGARGGS